MNGKISIDEFTKIIDEAQEKMKEARKEAAE